VTVAPSGSFIAEVHLSLLGFTRFFWATATRWIPLLFALGVWRHTVGGIALPHQPDRYGPRYWGIVPPLEMYTVSTFRLASEAGLDVLRVVPRVFVFIAFGARVVVTVGLVRRAVQWLPTRLQ
jgi:hypothetical protein